MSKQSRKFHQEPPPEYGDEREELLKDVFEDLSDGWDMVQKLFGERASPDHAIEVARLIGERFVEEDPEPPTED